MPQDPGIASSRISNSIPLADYLEKIHSTDQLPTDDIRPVLFGLFGEVGGIMAIAKKLRREEKFYTGFSQAALEEFGDALWYFSILCRRMSVNLTEVFSEVLSGDRYTSTLAATDMPSWPIAIARQAMPMTRDQYSQTLLELGEATSAMLVFATTNEISRDPFRRFVDCYIRSLQGTGLIFGEVLTYNIQKVRGRFAEFAKDSLPKFDDKFEPEERLPDKFEIQIKERKSGKTYLSWNGVYIGDPLTDSIRDEDGYRFHDVFHMAHAAILNWSPTFRALIKHKRKSNPKVDGAEDSGRAIVVEEGLTAWIFSRAKRLDFFQDKRGVSFDMLKTIQEFVSGYEVSECPLRLWESAILQGYGTFRQVRDNGGGIVICDRKERVIQYKPI